MDLLQELKDLIAKFEEQSQQSVVEESVADPTPPIEAPVEPQAAEQPEGGQDAVSEQEPAAVDVSEQAANG